MTDQQFALLSRREKIELLELLEEQERRASTTAARDSLLAYAHRMYPAFKEGPQHRKLAAIFEAVMRGEKKRVIVNIAPRFGKSEFSSYLFPSFYLGRFPDRKIIMATHTAGLSEDFGRRVRNIIQTPDYTELFPRTLVAADQKAAGKWSTSLAGQYYAVGVGGALAGRGADLLLIDDPHSEQDVRTNSKATFESCWAWYQTGPLQRLMPSGAIVIIMTRWATDDLTGRVLEWAQSNDTLDEWEVVELPAVLPSGRSLWPEQWPVEELLAKKAGMDLRYWSAQYMQNPTSEEGALIKRDWWRVWIEPKPPKCDFIIQSWDTAFTKTETADYSACTTWGVFDYPDDMGRTRSNIILLDAFKDRMEFPELKRVAFKHWEKWKPDAFIVEAKAAGLPLIHELRMKGIPVQEFTPSRGNDKTVRVNAVTDLFSSGIVWRPDAVWAREVAEECAAFPSSPHDDYVDTTTCALLRYRKGGFITLPGDEEEKPQYFKPRNRTRSRYAWT